VQRASYSELFCLTVRVSRVARPVGALSCPPVSKATARSLAPKLYVSAPELRRPQRLGPRPRPRRGVELSPSTTISRAATGTAIPASPTRNMGLRSQARRPMGGRHRAQKTTINCSTTSTIDLPHHQKKRHRPRLYRDPHSRPRRDRICGRDCSAQRPHLERAAFHSTPCSGCRKPGGSRQSFRSQPYIDLGDF
jgi:hypothetical protein